MIENWAIALQSMKTSYFSDQKHKLVTANNFLINPDRVINAANLQKFAGITPQYPGIRANLDPKVLTKWSKELSPMLTREFGGNSGLWSIRGWFSLVTTQPGKLLPIQRLPHVDGTDPNQIAMMLYLHRTEHGGTAFFRHLSTGFEALNDSDFAAYKAALARDVAKSGLPAAKYVTDGAPFFERIAKTSGQFNQAVFYRGNLLHSGIISNQHPLSPDPAIGRLTINAFLRPPDG